MRAGAEFRSAHSKHSPSAGTPCGQLRKGFRSDSPLAETVVLPTGTLWQRPGEDSATCSCRGWALSPSRGSRGRTPPSEADEGVDGAPEAHSCVQNMRARRLPTAKIQGLQRQDWWSGY